MNPQTEQEVDFQLAMDYAQKALTAEGEWDRFFWGLARLYWARANQTP